MIWNRLKMHVLACLLGVAAFGGCKQQVMMDPSDFQAAVTANLPKHTQENPYEAITPPLVERNGDGPASILDPSRKPRYVTLKECIAVALEQGNSGYQNPLQFGTKQDILPSFTGGTVTTTDAVRAFALDPANVGANIERALSKFDTRWITSAQWQKNDNPVAAQFVSFQQQNDTANVSTSLIKPLPTGGIAGVTFSVNYTKYSNVPAAQVNNFINPNYTPQLNFIFEQPLLRLFGVEVNQLSNIAPTSLLFSGLQPSGGQTTEGILLTRIRFDQSRADFERVINYQLVNVETAYWNLYSAYYNLYAQEEGLRQSYAGYRFAKIRVDLGAEDPTLLDQATAQFELFRYQVYTARGQILESERQLRGFMGLRSDDGERLVPIDEPNLAPFLPDYWEGANDAIALKPELLIARQDLKAQQLNLLLQKNLRRPDLRFYSQYNIAGIGTRLDGSENLVNPAGASVPGNALSNFSSNQFNSWTLGLRLDMPLGFRDQSAAVRQSELALTRSYVQLRDSELKAIELVVQQYRLVKEKYKELEPLRARREALQKYTARNQVKINIGKFVTTDFFNFLQVQRDLADSIRLEFAGIAQYNSALATYEFAKGTILRYNNIQLSEGALPKFVQQRATDHERERTEAALKLRERTNGDPAPKSAQNPVGPAVGKPTLPPLTDLPPALPDNVLKNPPIDSKKPATPPNTLPAPKTLPNTNSDALMPRDMPEFIRETLSPTNAAPVPGTPVSGGPQLDPNSVFVPTGKTATLPRLQPTAAQPTPAQPNQVQPIPLPAGNPLPATPNVSGIPATFPGSGQ